MFFKILIFSNSSFEIIFENLFLLVVLILIFLVAYIIAEIFWNFNEQKAISVADILDKGRKKHICFIRKQMEKPNGMFRVTITIFIFNFFGGILIWSTIGGLLIIFPFLHMSIVGFLVNLVLKRYPERKHWLTIPNIIFEIGAIVFTAIGGINLGISIWVGLETHDYFLQYKVLLLQITIPFLFIAAICESFLFRYIHIIKKHPWPY
jgi:hypothetical protein